MPRLRETHQISAAISERQRAPSATTGPELRGVGPRPAQHLDADIKWDHRRAPPKQRPRRDAGAGTTLQHPTTRQRLQRIKYAVGILRPRSVVRIGYRIERRHRRITASQHGAITLSRRRARDLRCWSVCNTVCMSSVKLGSRCPRDTTARRSFASRALPEQEVGAGDSRVGTASDPTVRPRRLQRHPLRHARLVRSRLVANDWAAELGITRCGGLHPGRSGSHCHPRQ